MAPSTDGTVLRMRVGDSSGIDSGAGNYRWHTQISDPNVGTAYAAAANNSDTLIQISGSSVGNAAGEGVGTSLWLNRPGDGTMKPGFSGTYTSVQPDTNTQGGIITAQRVTVITLDRIQVFFSSGDIATGRMTIWGLAHA